MKNRLDIFFGVSLHVISAVFLVRFAVDTGWRMVYPFIPQFSTGLGVSIIGFSWLIFVRSMAGMGGSLLGILADRYGRRVIMTTGLLAQGLGMAGIALSWQWWAIAPMVLLGFGSAAVIPAQQAYISDQVAYNKRGRALAFVDMSYPLASIIALPVVGRMIDTVSWRSPFVALSLLCLIAAVVIWFRLPAVKNRSHEDHSLKTTWYIFIKPNVLASIGTGLLVFLAASCIATVWGIWFSKDFGLDALALGVVATVIGLAELGGVGLSSLLIDRIGKRRGSLAGLVLVAASLWSLPLTQGTLFSAITMLVLTGASMEFTIVSLFPLYSEQAPEARATVFSLVGLGASMGLAIGSPITAILWQQVGLWAVCAVAIMALFTALLLVWRYLPEHSS